MCSDYFVGKGKVVTSKELTTRIINRTVFKLFREGLIAYRVVRKYGVRWDRFEITNRGKEAKC